MWDLVRQYNLYTVFRKKPNIFLVGFFLFLGRKIFSKIFTHFCEIAVLCWGYFL